MDGGAQPAKRRGTFLALFAGDIGFGDHYLHHPRAKALQDRLAAQGHGPAFDRLRPLFHSADVVIGNLEAPLSSRRNPGLVGRKSGLAWSAPGPAIEALRQSGITAVSLANDHALDCGRDGLAETLSHLHSAGIQSFGAGPSVATAAAPFLHPFRTGGVDRTLVVFGAFEYREHYDRRYRWYTRGGLGGVNPLSIRQLERDILSLRQSVPAPLFVVFPHWGQSYAPVSEAQRQAAAALFQAGADIVIGHGSHMAQEVAHQSGRAAVYGLGNCVWNTPGRYQIENLPPFSLVAGLAVGADGGVALRLFPIVTNNMVTDYRSRPTTETEFAQFLETTKGPAQIVTCPETGCMALEMPLDRPAPRRHALLFDLLKSS